MKLELNLKSIGAGQAERVCCQKKSQRCGAELSLLSRRLHTAGWVRGECQGRCGLPKTGGAHHGGPVPRKKPSISSLAVYYLFLLKYS